METEQIKKKKKLRPRSKKKAEEDEQKPSDEISKTKKKNKKKHEDRYFGRFHCKECNRRWDSAHVYTIGGTKKVKYKQACQKCKNWYFPHGLQILKCSQCNKSPCKCTCDECKKLKHKRFIDVELEDGSVETFVDDNFEYCHCEKGKKSRDVSVGNNIDIKKNHHSQLCQRCLKGRPCVYAKVDTEKENEP
ncbi:ZAR1-like protein [Bulinus truncatus]|nr:ZAR1-like protein [Bulinus truncatus]